MAFGIGLLPSVVTVALCVQNAMYGGPLKSGYGDLSFLFKIEHVWPNLQRYPLWLLETGDARSRSSLCWRHGFPTRDALTPAPARALAAGVHGGGVCLLHPI